MKQILMSVVLLTSFSFGNVMGTTNQGTEKVLSLSKSAEAVSISRISKVIVLDPIDEKGIEVRIVAEKLPSAAEVSQQYKMYLVFSRSLEGKDTQTTFFLGEVGEVKDSFYGSKSGDYNYLVGYSEFHEGGPMEFTLSMDMRKVFEKDATLQPEYQKPVYFNSSIEILRTPLTLEYYY